MKGIEVLNNIQLYSGETTDIYTYQNCSIKNSALVKGRELYKIAINKFLGNSLINRLKDTRFSSIEEIRNQLNPNSIIGSGDWIDLAGLIAPKMEIEKLLLKMENQQLSLEEIQLEFMIMHQQYYNYEWTWACHKLENYWKKSSSEITIQELVDTIEVWKTSVIKLDQLIYNDAKKEFSLNSKTGFGVDGDEEQKHKDFESVRGSFELNPFVIEVVNHIKKKSDLGDELISRLNCVTI
jgi:hypothetical protein